MTISTWNEEFQDLESADQVSTFSNTELLFCELVNFESLFRILVKDIFL
jgi:hypothetical protein